MAYAKLIRQFTSRDIDPRHVEAWMLSNVGGPLDHLPREQFATEVHTGIVCIEQGGIPMAEQLARSFGL